MDTETRMVAVDGTDALAYVIIRPNPDGAPENPIVAEAAAHGLSRPAAAHVLRQVANQFDPDGAPVRRPPFTVIGVAAFAQAVDKEREAQLTSFGDQRHPDIDHRDIPVVTHRYYEHQAWLWRQHNEERATPSRSHGRCTGVGDEPHAHTAWDGILLEEVYEALAEADPERLRAELIQVAAVCAAWIHDLDRR